MADQPPRYAPEVFEAADEAAARSIILTPKGDSSEQRWEKETPALVNDILEQIDIQPAQLVLDYGCGIGRIARELIQRTDCRVLGVDISAGMRRMAVDFVADERFSIVSRDVFMHMIASGLRVHHAIAVWVLQHSPEVSRDVELLYRSLQGEGFLYLLNNHRAAVPTDRGWMDDGTDIRRELKRRFAEIQLRDYPPACGNQAIAEFCFLGTYLRPPVVEVLEADG